MSILSPTKRDSVSYGLGKIWSNVKEVDTLSVAGMRWHVVYQAWKGLTSLWVTTVLTIITIAVSLLLLAAFILVVENLGGLLSATQAELTVHLYLYDSATDSEVSELVNSVKQYPGVQQTFTRSKVQALKDFQVSLGEHSFLLDGLEGENPLPQSIVVSFAQSKDPQEIFDSFARGFKGNNIVEFIQYDRGLVAHFAQIVKFIRAFGGASIVLLLILTGFIIMTTIKLALYSRRQEVEIMSLIGATPTFIKSPYILEGAFQGLFGAIIGIVVTYLLFMAFQDIVVNSEVLKAFVPKLNFISTFSTLLVIVLGGVIGGIGSWFAVKEFIYE